ncbi:MAG TPA: PEGA domain-containing protein [Tepidisphaeraceae bacterium]|nr:PEGA domain-containing protein [Tepidisphaeraceae bacterium]
MGRRVMMISLLVAMSGCVQRTMNVTSDPDGAIVFMNGQEIGRTPLTRDFLWYGTYDVQVRKEGYETLNERTRVIAPIWQWPPFDLAAEFWPGRLKDIRHLSYKLKPATTGPADANAMIAGAAELRAKLESSQYTRSPSVAPTSQPAHSTTQPSR